MSSIVFVTWDGGGNVAPALGIGAELRERGHAVRVLGHPGQADSVSAAGLAFTGFPTARPHTSTDPGGRLALLAVIGDRAMGRDVLADLDTRGADLVVVDCVLFAVMDTLRRAGRPYAVLEHVFDGFLRGAAKGPMGLALRARRLPPLELIDAGTVRVTATVRELDQGHGDVTHVGPLCQGVPAHPEQPTVLVSLSTYAFPALAKTWQRVLDALDGLDARIIATTGPAIDPAGLRVPTGVELHRWLDHRQVMPTASLVVGHGGHGTTMAALAHDLPVLVLPLDSGGDQPFVGRVVEAAGAGRTLSRRSSPTRIRTAIEELLLDGSHRKAAARLGHTIRSYDGRTAGAEALEQLLLGGAAQLGPGPPRPQAAESRDGPSGSRGWSEAGTA